MIDGKRLSIRIRGGAILAGLLVAAALACAIAFVERRIRGLFGKGASHAG